MGAFVAAAYRIAVYVFFAVTFAYAIGFVGNLAVPKGIDSGAAAPLPESLLVDLLLLGLFALQHSVMARRGFKRWWTRIIPPAMERSTYVLAASGALALLLWQWRPIAEPVLWRAEGAAALVLQAVFWLGWAVLLASTFLINHFELFGLANAAAPEFRTPGFYRYVRHPIYVGFLLAFWAAPVMSAGHLLFAVATTGYILVGIWFEERDLVHQFGERYRLYREQVGMLLPWKITAGRRRADPRRPAARAD